jgi:ABC-type sulfate/molybdate transport systems ATPase subunit
MLDLNDKNFLVIPDENGAAAVGWKDSPNFDGQNVILHKYKIGRLFQKTSLFAMVVVWACCSFGLERVDRFQPRMDMDEMEKMLICLGEQSLGNRLPIPANVILV